MPFSETDTGGSMAVKKIRAGKNFSYPIGVCYYPEKHVNTT